MIIQKKSSLIVIRKITKSSRNLFWRWKDFVHGNIDKRGEHQHKNSSPHFALRFRDLEGLVETASTISSRQRSGNLAAPSTIARNYFVSGRMAPFHDEIDHRFDSHQSWV